MPINKEFALNDNISESFTNLLGTLSGFRSQITEIQNTVRVLEKQVIKEIKQQDKKINKNKFFWKSCLGMAIVKNIETLLRLIFFKTI